MKQTLLLFAFSIYSIAALSQVSNSTALKTEQANCQANYKKLQQENEYLKKSLKILQGTKSVENDGLELKLLKAEGNSKEQTVTFRFAMTNHKANSEFQFSSAQAIDVQGNDFQSREIRIGNEHWRNTLYTDTPIQSTIVLKQVLPSVKIIKLLSINHYAAGLFPKGSFELRDIEITWN